MRHAALPRIVLLTPASLNQQELGEFDLPTLCGFCLDPPDLWAIQRAVVQGLGYYRVALLVEQSIETGLPTARASIPGWPTLADHDVVLILQLARAVSEDVF